MKPITVLGAANAELVEAAEYYESRSANLGVRFLAEVESALGAIATGPARASLIRNSIRRRLLPQFPYAILYRDDPNEIVVIAIMHLHRRPGYWAERF